MNIAPPREFSRLVGPVQDLRAQYETDVANVARVLWSRKFLIAAVVIGMAAAAAGGAKLLGKTYVGEALIQLRFGNDSAAPPGTANVSVDAAAVVEGEAEIIRSRVIARRVLDHLDRQAAVPAAKEPGSLVNPMQPSLVSPAETAETALAADSKLLSLQKGLTVKNDGKTYLIHIVYAANDPIRAAMVANAFADEYLESRVEVSVNSAQRTSDWLKTQVAQAVARREQAAEKVRQFRERPDVIAANSGNPQTGDEQMRDMISQISAAQQDQLKLEARLQRLTEAAKAGQVPSAPDLQGSTDAQRLIEAEVTARQEASRLEQMTGTKHPLYIRAEKTLEAARQQLADAVSAAIRITQMDLESARSSQKSLDAQFAALKTTALGSQMIGNKLKELEADETTAQSELDRLREAHRQALALTELKPIAAQLVSSAEPVAVPASPRMTLVVLLGGMGGFVFSLLLVFLLQLRDVGFVTGTQAASNLGVACAGMFPALSKTATPADRHIYSQAMKFLAIATGLAEPRKNCTVVVVTSTLPGEGKSDLVRGLAASLSRLERRVLIVEDSGRRPVEQAVSEHDGPRGQEISATASEERIASTDVTQYHRASDDLYEIFSCHDRFQTWIEKAGLHFDIVIVEAPAVMTDVRAVLIARAADLVLFAVRWRSTPKQAAAAAFRQLIPASGQAAMAVITEVDLTVHRQLGPRDSLYFSRRYASAGRPQL